MKELLAAVALLMVAAAAHAEEDLTSGNWWLEGCKRDSDALCSGYVIGMMEMHDLSRPSDQWLWCLPKGVTPRQVTKVIVRYMNNHPADLHQRFVILASLALNESFPCPPDTASVSSPR